MADLLYYVVEKMAGIHDVLMTLNDSYETMFSDKELHFIVIGVLGMAYCSLFCVFCHVKTPNTPHNTSTINVMIFILPLCFDLRFLTEESKWLIYYIML